MSRNAVHGLLLVLVVWVACLVTHYGGIRSVDAEIVFRAGEGWAAQGALVVTNTLQGWAGFGVAPGVDGRSYSVFGPLQSVVAAPLIRGAQSWANRSRWNPPISFFIGNGLSQFMQEQPASDPGPHRLRYAVSLLNPLVAALGVGVFWMVVLSMTRRVAVADLLAVLYGFGTLQWPYAGTFMSEPLAVLWVLLSFLMLVRMEAMPGSRGGVDLRALWSGLFLGCGICTHITAILFVPFWGLYALWPVWQRARNVRAPLVTGLWFGAGLALVLGLLAWYNATRFGSVFETGRAVDPTYPERFGYGTWTAPWHGLYGLLIGGGKGVIWYCPPILVAVFFWRRFGTQYRLPAVFIGAAAVLRVVFLAVRSDWHGGYCLGPRFLVMLIPFIMLGLIPFVEQTLVGKRGWRVAWWAFAGFCVCWQWRFCLGEVFSYYHLVKHQFAESGVNVFEGLRIYLAWDYSPVLYLLKGHAAPCLVRSLGGRMPVWLWGGNVVLLTALSVFCWATWRTNAGLHRAAAGDNIVPVI